MKIKTKLRPRRGWRRIFQRRQRAHDPLLAFNMSVFNSDSTWRESLGPLKTAENVG